MILQHKTKNPRVCSRVAGENNQQPEMKGKKVHQRYVASTHTKKLIQRQTNRKTPAPMKMGTRFVFFAGAPE